MPFEFKKVLEHGTSNPIVARLSFQSMQLLQQTSADKAVQDAVGKLYFDSLQKKLIRCHEIEERFKKEFAEAAAKYKPPATANSPVDVPQIARLEEECHNFLYEAKNYMRDLLQVFNKLYGTSFEDASECSRAKKGGQSLVEYAEATFGPDDAKTKMLKEAVPFVENIIAKRNAVEHPGGYSGELVITNFTRRADNFLDEPGWYRVKDGKSVETEASIRADMNTAIHNLLTLGEDVLVLWVAEHLLAPQMMQIAKIPEERRDPKSPIKYTVTLSKEMEEKLLQATAKRAEKKA